MTEARRMDLEGLRKAAAKYRRGRRARSTRRSYERALADWEGFLAAVKEKGEGGGMKDEGGAGDEGGGAELVCLWLADMAGRGSVATVRARLAGLRDGLDRQLGRDNNPARASVVGEVMEGIARTHGTRQAQRTPLSSGQVGKMVKGLPLRTNAGRRDRAMFLVQFLTGMRGAELAALDWADVCFVRRGVTLFLATSKTDQFRRGRLFGLDRGKAPLCPRSALRAWQKAVVAVEGKAEGAVFRTMLLGDRISKTRLHGAALNGAIQAAVAGLKLAGEGYYGSHSMRAGLVTELLGRGVSESVVMQRTGHRDAETMRRYYRDGEAWRVNYTELTGLGEKGEGGGLKDEGGN